MHSPLIYTRSCDGRGMGVIRLKRVYDDASPDDGMRVLVDRLWPRGLSREAAKVDLWLKGLAPSEELRHWFNHDPERWPEFRKRYRAEIAENSEDLETLRRLVASKGPVTLLFAAKDTEHNNAVVLKELLLARRGYRGVKKQRTAPRRSNTTSGRSNDQTFLTDAPRRHATQRVT